MVTHVEPGVHTPTFSFSMPAAQPDPERDARLAELLANVQTTGRVYEYPVIPKREPGWEPTAEEIAYETSPEAFRKMELFRERKAREARALLRPAALRRACAKNPAAAGMIVRNVETFRRCIGSAPTRPRAAARARRAPRSTRTVTGTSPPADDPAPGPSARSSRGGDS